MTPIESYLKSGSRNKLVFCKTIPPDLIPLNLGKSLSKAIYPFLRESKLPMIVAEKVDELFKNSSYNHPTFGKILVISNIGILFEPKLKINFQNLITMYSLTNILFVLWDGELENGQLYFLTKENGIQINIVEISHILI